ncbi:MAG: carboxymuconolactone decarboxylase family protein [Dehalococcoidia bacterium]
MMAIRSKRKVYGSWREFFADLLFIPRNTMRFIRAYRGALPPSLRETLMVAAAAVSGCRFCSWLHTKQELRAGIDKQELAGVVEGVVKSYPEEYNITLLYAQPRAKSNAYADPEAIRRLEETHGRQEAKLINVVASRTCFALLAEDSVVPFVPDLLRRMPQTEEVRSIIWIS